MGDIFQEVDADLRQDRYSRLWRRYGRYVIGGAVLLVLGTAANVGWKHYSTERRQALGNRFVAAEQIEPPAAAADALHALAGDGTAGYAMLARLRAADLKAAAGDIDGAVALYEEVAADASADALYRDAALLHAVVYRLDTAPAEQTAARLQPLTADDNPWRYTARELLAAAALRGGDTAAARDRYTRLVDDPGAPAGMRGRASEMLRALGS
ncbi:MAG: tetratricopeptide repeat protein [Alphaproteobacteria bacterium]